MNPRKRIYDLSERFAGYLLDRAGVLAFPGRNAPLSPILLIALPKSGSIYLQRALRRTLRVPVHHIASGGMSGATFRHADLCRFEQGNVVCREHLQPRTFSLKVLARHGVGKAVLHVRDPRAAIVSWTRHMDRTLTNRGVRAVELFCEMIVPDAYPQWTFAERLEWQVENKMPQFVRWIEDWLELVERSREMEFLTTDYGALCGDARGLVTRILDFHGIDWQPDWISMPAVRVGKNNIFTLPVSSTEGSQSTDVLRAAWADMPRELFEAANAKVPQSLVGRFGWTKP